MVYKSFDCVFFLFLQCSNVFGSSVGLFMNTSMKSDIVLICINYTTAAMRIKQLVLLLSLGLYFLSCPTVFLSSSSSTSCCLHADQILHPQSLGMSCDVWRPHLTLQDCESLSLWNQDCWAWRLSALVITPSFSKLRKTDLALSLSFAVSRRTNEFYSNKKARKGNNSTNVRELTVLSFIHFQTNCLELCV